MTDDTREGEGLAACPFCGGEADLSFEHGHHPNWWKVTCLNCGCRTQSNTTHKAVAIAAWNRRPLRGRGEGAAVRALLGYVRDAALTRPAAKSGDR